MTPPGPSTSPVVYISDPSTIARTFLPDPVRETDLRSWVDMVADGGIDIFGQEVFSQGWTAYWTSDDYEYDQRPQHRRFRQLIDAGTQPLEVLVDQAHHRGMRFVAGFRMNDGHAYQARAQGVDIAAFIAANPQLRLQPGTGGKVDSLPESLDFSHREVRDFTLGVIREVVTRFDVDAVELCFRDIAYFPEGTARDRAHLMSELIKQIRELFDSHVGGSGDPLILGARVHSTPGETAGLGLNVPDWIARDLLDYVSPQDTMYSDFSFPCSVWSELTRRSNCKLYPVIQPWTSYRGRYRRKRIPLSWANARALAHSYYGAGADGVSAFNHFVTGIWNPPFFPHALQVFRQLKDRERIASRERHYIFEPTWAGFTGFGEDGRCTTGIVKSQRLRLERSVDAARGTYEFVLYEDLERSHAATLLFRGMGMTENDDLEVRLNGRVVPPASIRRTAPMDAERVDGDYIDYVREEDGRRIPCQPEAGWFDFRREPGPPHSTRWFTLTSEVVVRGPNQLSVTLVQSDPGARQDAIVIDEVEVFVEPK